MKKLTVLLLLASILLTGCKNWGNGSYISVKPHPTQAGNAEDSPESVKNYDALCESLRAMIHNTSVSGKLLVGDYDGENLEDDIHQAIAYLMQNDAVAAYAVENITYKLGDMGTRKALVITIDYYQNRTAISQIQQASNMAQAKSLVYQALDHCDAGIVLRIENYSDTDFALLVQSYTFDNPHLVMEQPLVTAGIYPDSGNERVVELVFTYQTGRDSLRQMQEYVAPVFQASRLNVIGEEEESVRYSLMFSFLVERNNIKLDTSITPAYSVLRYGVGDSKSFAAVFAAMCRYSQLECLVVSGTKDGQPYFWNMICQDGEYYHVDILRDRNSGELVKYTDDQLIGYVWDFDDYPACGVPEENILQEDEK